MRKKERNQREIPVKTKHVNKRLQILMVNLLVRKDIGKKKPSMRRNIRQPELLTADVNLTDTREFRFSPLETLVDPILQQQ